MKYKIITLNDEDFSRLPYERAIASCGITDRILGVSYIRDTGDVDFDVDTLIHEINEMENDVSPYGWTHEDKFGVRYKSWFQKTFIPESKSSIGSILGTLGSVALAPFTGGASLAYMPLTGAIGGAIGGSQEGGGIGSTLLGGLKGFGVGSVGTGLNAALKGAGTGLKSNVQEFVQGAQAPTQKLTSGISNTLNKATNWLNPTASQATSSLNQFGVSGLSEAGKGAITSSTADLLPTSSGTGLMSQGFNQAMASNPSLNLLGSAGAIKSALESFSPSIGSTGTQSGLSSFNQPAQKTGLSSLTKLGLGTALTAAGQSAKVPDIQTSRFTTMMEQGGITPRTEIGNAAMKKQLELLNQGYTGLTEEYKTAILADLEKQFQDEERVLKQNYKSLRPYADIENDSAYNKDLIDLKREQTEYQTNLLAKLEQANLEEYNKNVRQDIQTAMGIDEQTFNEYASLANQDLNTIMMQTGLDYGTAQQFQQLFGSLGGELISSGLGLSGSSLDNFKLS